MSDERSRMIFDLPAEVQMAIKLRAVKNDTTTGGVVAEAIRRAFPEDVKQAEAVLAERATGWPATLTAGLNEC